MFRCLSCKRKVLLLIYASVQYFTVIDLIIIVFFPLLDEIKPCEHSVDVSGTIEAFFVSLIKLYDFVHFLFYFQLHLFCDSDFGKGKNMKIPLICLLVLSILITQTFSLQKEDGNHNTLGKWMITFI